MAAFSSVNISPLDLKLDNLNPRFIIPQESSDEQDIINHLIEHEDVLVLCRRLNDIGTILPGERIVVCKEENSYVVLEGNRRICCCKMLLDQTLIPKGYENQIPDINNETLLNIKSISVDVVQSREIAKKYLAARHINGVRDWSTIAKMRFAAEEFKSGQTIEQIRERTSLQLSKIRDLIKEYNLLTAGIDNCTWTRDESKKLTLTELKPNRYLRIFNLERVSDFLGLEFNENLYPFSTKFKNKDFYKILGVYIRAAFIDETLSTRSSFFDDGDSEGVVKLIKHIVDKYPSSMENKSGDKEADTTDAHEKTYEKGTYVHTNTKKSEESATEQTGYKHEDKNGSVDADTTDVDQKQNTTEPTKTKVPSLWGALSYGSIDNMKHDNKGLIKICEEATRFSKNVNIRNYPMASVYLTRALLEHTLIHYAKKRNQWQYILNKKNNKESAVNLSDIIKHYIDGISNYFDSADDRALFLQLFKNYNDTANKFNWVVHRPNSYLMSPETLQTILDEGLFDLIQKMINFN